MNIYCSHDLWQFAEMDEVIGEFLNIPELRIELLCYLGQAYHTYFGLSWEPELYIDPLDQSRLRFWNDWATVYGEEDGEICVSPDGDVHEVAERYIGYSTVIIKHRTDNWYQKPDEWYNRHSKWFKNRPLTRRQQKPLEFLQARGYIKVTKPFMEVVVDADVKGLPLTYDDVLFATRALCPGETCSYNDFLVLKGTTHDVLILEPDVED
jgi:hypothetical protein